MESIVTTLAILAGPVVMWVVYQLFPEWFNVRKTVTMGILAVMVAGITLFSWVWTKNKSAEAKQNVPASKITIKGNGPGF